MSWNKELMEALKDPQQLKRISELARNRYQPIERPVFDYKSVEAEGRQPGDDEVESA